MTVVMTIRDRRVDGQPGGVGPSTLVACGVFCHGSGMGKLMRKDSENQARWRARVSRDRGIG
jgi:hypothetical protein